MIILIFSNLVSIRIIIIINFINMHDRNYRGTKVMQVYDLENNFLKHRQRIIKTRSKDMVVQVKMQYRDQM
jgi:hypothetical protein